MIAVTFALPSESATFTRLLKEQGPTAAEVRVFHTGVGRSAAEARIREFLEQHAPALLISSGFAGALTDQLRPADLVLAQNYTSPQWLTRAQGVLGTDARPGTLATASTITDTSEDRARLAARTGASAVDMESEFIAAACKAAAVPIITLRGISDTPAAPMPLPAHVLFDLEAQRTRYGALALYLASHPASLPRLVAFSRQIVAVRQRLARGLLALVRSAL